MLNIVICDDNSKILNRLEKLLETIFIKNNISATIVLKATTANEVLSFIKDNTAKLIAGGPMMGRAMISLKNYARKTDSGLLLLTDSETSLKSATNCINCGVCAKNCPMRLMPMYIESFTLAEDYKNAEKYGAMNCIECGSCAFNCPAKRALVQSITMAKSKIKEMKKNG